MMKQKLVKRHGCAKLKVQKGKVGHLGDVKDALPEREGFNEHTGKSLDREI